MSALTAPDPTPRLTVIDGGLDESEAEHGRQVALENAWVEVQAVAQDAQAYANGVLTTARRIQVAIARGLDRQAAADIERAGQFAHELELGAPLHAFRARRSELEAKAALDGLTPKRPEPVA